MHGRVSEKKARDESTGATPTFPVLAVVLFVGVLAIFADLARGGFLLSLDSHVSEIWKFRGPYDYPYADAVDRIGQRLICLPLLVIVAFYLSRRIRSIRPLVIAIGSTIALNGVIGVLKLASGRESPRTGGPELFVGDNVLFPSGHTANTLFVYGLIVALLVRYGSISPPVRRLLWAVVAGITVLMTIISVYRHTHWFSDLVAGAMVGAAMLQLTLLVDLGWSGVRRWLRRLAGPTWVVVEWGVGLIRRRIVPPLKLEAGQPATPARGDQQPGPSEPAHSGTPSSQRDAQMIHQQRPHPARSQPTHPPTHPRTHVRTGGRGHGTGWPEPRATDDGDNPQQEPGHGDRPAARQHDPA
ncbi:phosphatase PAP2 family protein [Actinopolymorpha pittospori]|uniref:Membrane-associated phospholipid phosphatase n=1 Tax=Actinopolymorpha pittospori TaxID=648752 RepID=A0A927N2N7_9ACTN|nr:phosphatase PAP2 family protein [Actinopolymorpha pittospori]MBE1611555.1 membrane-associated phospholipid phosphatase [Actinopolymorpha pittospori]